MTTSFKLIAKVLSSELPPRVVLWVFLSKINRLLGIGNRRFELERMYLERRDPWNYYSSSYERQKYERTLACVLEWRRARESALELACSVGAFSGMLAAHFDQVTAIDLSQEALRTAIEHNRGKKNLRFVQDDIRFFELGYQYDVIICAEVLMTPFTRGGLGDYYLKEEHSQRLCHKLDEHLGAHGTIFVVSGISGNKDLHKCNDVLGAYFQQVFQEIVEDPARPYQIVVFSRRALNS